MKLIIAEKPSLARNIADAIGGMRKQKSYFEGETYLVTWAFGHLFSLCDIEAYRTEPNAETGKKWTMEGLPCFPKKFRFELRKDDSGQEDQGVKRQFEAIQTLCRRPDVDTIINAGDSDREGEIIVRLIIDHALTPEEKKSKSLQRLWMPDQTPETIRAGLAAPGDEKEYDNLAYEGYARTLIDWLYGVNLTRYATLRTGTLLRVGRVIVPIVRAIYDRDQAISRFEPEKYYGVQSDRDGMTLTSKEKFSKDEKDKAEALCAAYNALGGTVKEVKKKKGTLSPGKLYSLSTLQNALSKKFKMSMNDSLALVQKLYEAGYITYPRTNSEYLATAEKDRIKTVLEKVAGLGYPVTFREGKTIFDDSKIESHSALTPTGKIPPKDKLSPEEKNVYAAILRRFVAVFCEQDCVVDRSELVIDIGDPARETFRLKGMVIREPGWTKYDDYSGKDKVLPELKKGQHIETAFVPTEKTTSPPKHYTVETLNNYLKNPFREELSQENAKTGEEGAASDEEEYRAVFEGLELGTEATRTGIIENARKSRYIQLKNDVYTILPDGKYLIESLSRMNIGMDKYKTAQVGKSLKRVYRGECPIGESLRIAEQEIAEVFQSAASPNPTWDEGFFGDEIGVCPLCGGTVKKGKYGYGCDRYKEGCKFRIPIALCGRTIPVTAAKQLLETGETDPLQGFISKKGSTFSARLKREEDKINFDFS